MLNSSRKKTALLVLLLLLVLSGLFIFSWASTIEESQEDLDKVNQEIEKHKQLIQETKVKENLVLRDLYIINKQLSSIKHSLLRTKSRLEDTTTKISRTQQELTQVQSTYREKQNRLGGRLKEIYKTQNLGYLYLFFSSKSFSDLVENSYYFSRIIASDLQTLTAISQARSSLAQKKNELYSQKNQISQLKDQMEREKEGYSSKAKIKENIYSSLKAKRQEYEQRMEELQRNSQEIEAMIRRLRLSGPSHARSTGKFNWPVRGVITSGYGYRRHPIFKITKFHTGIDIASPAGTRIGAADSGIVVFSGWWGGYGKAIIIDHGRNYSTVYGHLSRIQVKRDDVVEKGQTIGLVGSTGYSTGPHLHFEIRIDGRTVDPTGYLP